MTKPKQKRSLQNNNNNNNNNNKTAPKKANPPRTQNAKRETAELGRLAKALRWGGGFAGGLINPALAASGSNLGAMLSKWLGAGDYRISSNSLVLGNSSANIPAMHSTNMSAIIRHKEYIGDVITSSSANTFHNTAYTINPGLDISYPWLAAVAQNYEEYTIRGMIYHFVSTSADALNSTNTALGTVMMATQYRSTAAAFTNKQQIMNEFFANDSKPSESFCHPIECDPKENPYNVQYVRGSAVPSGEDAKTYDLGTFNIATTGFQGTSVNVGELHVTYEVELRKPIITSTLNTYGEAAHYRCATATSADPLGSGTIIKVYDGIGISVNTYQVTMPIGAVGNYVVAIYYASPTALSSATVAYTNCAESTWSVAGVNISDADSTYTAGTSATALYGFTISDASLQAIFQINTKTITGATTVDVYVTQLPSGFL